MRPLLKPLSSLLIVGGVVMFAWPFGQTLYGKWSQRTLAAQFAASQKGAPLSAKAKGKILPVSAKKKMAIAPWPLTKISVPGIGLNAYVVQGWDEAHLRRGPGHYELSAPLGEGNCVIMGHRNVYGSPFGDLDKLFPGTPVVLQNQSGTFTYIVDSTSVASASDWRVTLPPPSGARPVLTLLTCTLPHTPNRVVVRALLAK